VAAQVAHGDQGVVDIEQLSRLEQACQFGLGGQTAHVTCTAQAEIGALPAQSPSFSGEPLTVDGGDAIGSRREG